MTRAVLADFADFRALHERRSAMEEAKQERQKSKSEKQDEKVIILPGATEDGFACTFAIMGEDHTIGNALRYMIMQNPNVEFCGYSAPHPSEFKIHLRIQMYPDSNQNALNALQQALTQLEQLFGAIKTKYNASIEKGEYERFSSSVDIDWDKVKAKAKANKEAKKREQQQDSMDVL